MQKNAMAEKRKILVDNTELPGLVKVAGLPLEEGTIEVPGFNIKRSIQNGVIVVAPFDATYKLERSTKTRDFLNNWKMNREQHDVTIIQCDASGQEFGRYLAPQCGLSKLDPGEADLGNPNYAHLDITFVPYDLQPVPAQQ